MADIHIQRVHTDLEITDNVGTLSPADVRKLVALVVSQIKAQKDYETLRKDDDQLKNTAYVSDVTT